MMMSTVPRVKYYGVDSKHVTNLFFDYIFFSCNNTVHPTVTNSSRSQSPEYHQGLLYLQNIIRLSR